jgi:hypothetical protein
MELQSMSLGATPSRGVDVAAAPAVSLEYGTPNGGGDVTSALAVRTFKHDASRRALRNALRSARTCCKGHVRRE